MSTDRWMDKEGVVCMCIYIYIYTHIHTHTHTHTQMEYYSAIKKWNNAICSNMDGPRDDNTKWTKSDRERQISYGTTFLWNLKKWYKWTDVQNRNRLTDTENKLMVTKGAREGRDKLGFGINRYTLLYIK